MKQKTLIIALILLACASVVFAASSSFGTKKRMPRPEEYGNVLINNNSEKANIAPVVFKHWLHRTKYTCRVCHVDIGFATEAGGSEIKEADNKNHLYCGSCHNGTIAFGPTSREKLVNEVQNCDLCHSYGKEVKFKYDFNEFVKNFPQARFGNRVDWIKAEQAGMFKLQDVVPGVSIKRKPIAAPKDFDIKSTILGMPDTVFSHKIHADINGCELCHPEIFGSTKGVTKFNMQDIFAGKYCGACHAKVAFPFYDCQLCHLKEVY
jgi:c(7)-type cytochrome triheme protein